MIDPPGVVHVLGTVTDPRQAESAVDGCNASAVVIAPTTGGNVSKTKEIRLDVEAKTHKRLADLAKREGGSIAVMVRRAINMLLDQQSKEVSQ